MERTYWILLVEDDEVDTEAVVRVIERRKLPYNIVAAKNGKDALTILKNEAPFIDFSAPYLILLDLNLPGMNGHEFLANVREDQELRSSIIFVFTSSDREEDIAAAFAKNVAGYMVKSNVGSNLDNLFHLLEAYRCAVEFPRVKL